MIDDLMSYIPRYNDYNRNHNIDNNQSDDDKSLAMVYIPFQKWQKLYSEEVALNRGTLFSELDKPFIGEEAVSNE